VRLEERSDIATPPLGIRKPGSAAPATAEAHAGSSQSMAKVDPSEPGHILPLHKRPKPA
jgi:hypothetical protein